MKPLPHTIKDLVEQLDLQYPHRCLAAGQSIEDAHRYAGKRALIDELQQRLEATAKRGLKDELKI